jgi:translocation protein SEC63
MAILARKMMSVEADHVEYDPYAILELDRGATSAEVRKQYRRLSLEHHPDKGGDEQTFVRLTKAYKAYVAVCASRLLGVVAD